MFAIVLGVLLGNVTSRFLPALVIGLTAFAMFFHYPQAKKCDNRSMAIFLQQNAKDNDVVIFTSLTRLPIDYYLGNAAHKHHIIETSFPAEIDQHPGYEGHLNDRDRKAAFQLEAQRLTERVIGLKSNGASDFRVFFFKGRYPELDELIERPLGERLQVDQGLSFKCPEDVTYFNEVTVFK
jgi:hypothetical protein